MAGQLVVKSVELENFLSHRSSVVEFPESGVTVFVGRNGSGKSSIVEAIYFAFTGEGWRTGSSTRGLINERAQEARVTLKFALNGEEYTVERGVSRGGGSSAFLFRGGRKLAEGTRVGEELKRLLGMSPFSLDGVVLVPQGGITRIFADLKPKERMSLLDGLLGLEKFERAYEALREVCANVPGLGELCPERGFERRIAELRSTISGELARQERRREELAKRLKELDAEVVARRKLIEDAGLEGKAKRLEEVAKELEGLRARAAALGEAASRHRKEREELERELARLGEEAAEAERRLRELEPLAGVWRSAREPANELSRLLETASSLRKLVEEMHKRLEGLQQASAAVRELEARYGSREALASRREDLSRQLEAVESELQNEREGRATLEGRLRAFLERIGEIEHQLARAFGGPQHVPSQKEVAARLERANEELEGRERELERLRRELARLEGEIDHVEKELEILRTSAEPVCPLCRRPLDAARKEEIVAELEGKLGVLRTRRNELLRFLPGLEEEVRRLRDSKDLLAKAAEELVELERLRNEYEKARAALDTIDARVRKIEEYRERLRAEISEVESALQKWDTALAVLRNSNINELERLAREYEEQLKNAEASAKELAARLGELVGATGSPAEVLVAVRRRLEEAEGAALEAERLRERLERLRAEIEEKRRRMAVVEGEAKVVEGELRELSKRIEGLEGEVKDLKAAKEQLDRLKAEIEGLEGEKRARAEEWEKLEGEVRELRRRAEETETAAAKVAVLAWIRENVLQREKFPARLRKYYVGVLSRLAEEFVDDMGLGFSRVEIDEEYNVKLCAERGYCIEYARLSGGEKVSAGLAILLAIHRLVTHGRIGFLVLDEPTEYLDEERRRGLVEVLKRFRGGVGVQQLIVVTHDEEVRDAADVVYRVRKEGPYSRVEAEAAWP
ncbi:MAG: SMC family ATPase [Desulfurococcaceae archaeon]